MAEFAEETVSELGWGNDDGYLSGDQLQVVWSFLDFDHIAHELEISGDYYEVDARPYGVHIFRAS